MTGFAVCHAGEVGPSGRLAAGAELRRTEKAFADAARTFLAARTTGNEERLREALERRDRAAAETTGPL